jgi:mono/diheme cytochrome c family protein
MIACADGVIRKVVLLTVVGLGALGAIAGALVVGAGLYDIAANEQHTQPVYVLLEKSMHQSVRRKARDLAPPATLDTPAALQRGAACYQQHCVKCHGAPGVAREPFAMAMEPAPGPLIDAWRDWRLREIYWITRNGIKMTGMPAWQMQLGDEDLWAVAAFTLRLREMSAADYAAHAAGVPAGATCDAPEAPAGATVDVERGKTALHQYACHACHSIPGISGPDRQVGPPLAGIGTRRLIAGRLPNTHDNMALWIREPRRIDPETAMPDLGVTARDARDMAAYLATLR